MTTDKITELEAMIAAAIPARAKDCPVEIARKKWSREQLKIKIIAFIATL